MVEFITAVDSSYLSITDQIWVFIARLLDYFLKNRNRFFYIYRFHYSVYGSEYRKMRGKILSDIGYLLSSLLQKGIDEGVIVDVPIDVHFKFCIDVIMTIVRDHHLSIQPLTQPTLEQIPHMCLKSLLK